MTPSEHLILTTLASDIAAKGRAGSYERVALRCGVRTSRVADIVQKHVGQTSDTVSPSRIRAVL